MSVSINLNTAEFQDTLRKYLAVTSRTLPEALNQKMFYIARGASRLTPKTSREVIEQELGVTGYKTVYNRDKKLYAIPNAMTGGINISTVRVRGAKAVGSQRGGINIKRTRAQLVKNAILKTGALAFLIINRRLGRAGKKGLFGAGMKAAVDALLRKRFRSVGTLKAGWLGAIRTLGSVVGETERIEGASSIIKGRSTARPARDGFNPQVSLEYNTNSFDRSHRPYIDARLQAALTFAFQAEQRSMEEYLIKKLQNRIDAIPTRHTMTNDEAMAFIKRMTRQ